MAAPVIGVPAGWQATFARLRLASDARVLVVPVASGRRPQVMRWQADTGEPRLMIGGYFVGPNKTVQQMISNGAQLFPEDVDVVTKYLSTYLVAGSLAGAAK